MNSQSHLENLVARYIEGNCCPAEFKELEARLLEDAGNRKYFMDMVLLAEDLGMMSSRQRGVGVVSLPVGIMPGLQPWRTAKTALLAAAAVIFFSAVAIWPQMAPLNEEAALANCDLPPASNPASH